MKRGGFEISCMKQSCQNILLIQLGDIGDVVLSIPAFRAVRDQFPQANIIVAVREKAKELIQHVPWVNGVMAINQDQRSLLDEISYQWMFFSLVRSYHFDLVFDFRTGTRGAILAFLSGAKERVGFFDPEGFWRNRLFTHLYRLDYHASMHVAAYYFSLLQAYGLIVAHEAPEMHVTSEVQKHAARILNKEGIPSDWPIIAIQPFSLWGYKEWSIHKYAQLIQWILSARCISIVITGSQHERERAKDLIDRCAGHGFEGHEGRDRQVFNLAGKTSLGELAALIRSCRLFIGSDSSGMHIAAAVGTPTVVIFGPSAPASWAPAGDDHAIVQKDLPCVPCRQKGCDGSEVSRCLDELEVDEVRAVVQTQLKKLGISV
jgi:predicted lipopolysaccharide heptosyltransferase III